MNAIALSILLAAAAPGASRTQVLQVGAEASAPAVARRPLSRAGSPTLVREVRASVADVLPAGWRLGAVRLHEGSQLPPGRWALAAELPDLLADGDNLVQLQATATNGSRAQVFAWAQLSPSGRSGRAATVLARNQEVVVVVRSGNVVVQSKGICQQAAGLGERIVVLPHNATHTVQGVVRDNATVEVHL